MFLCLSEYFYIGGVSKLLEFFYEADYKNNSEFQRHLQTK
jgi:hypothetical protein